MSIEVEVSPEKLKIEITKLVEEMIKLLNNEKIQLFKNKPTINIFHLKNEIIGVSLIDENLNELKCEITHRPKKGIIYFYISKIWVRDFYNIEEFAKDKIQKIIEDIQSENAYTLNMKRVKDLIRNGHYAVAIVFLISAFENIAKDLFLNHNDLWFFTNESVPNMNLLREFGIRVDDDESSEFKPFYFVGDEGWYFEKEKYKKYNQWSRIEHMNYVFNLCKNLRILDQYKLLLMGNNMQEIGYYEVLKRTIVNSLGKFSIINFQSIKGKGSVKWCFKNFFSIDLTPMSYELDLLQKLLLKRHKIIHGFLKDDKISKEFAENSYDVINKIISFLKDQINEWYHLVP